jgi:hypothetical protein
MMVSKARPDQTGGGSGTLWRPSTTTAKIVNTVNARREEDAMHGVGDQQNGCEQQ